MAASEVAICNSALIKVGAQTIVALTDQNERARVCNEQYAKCRDEVLSSHPWHFAKLRAQLAASVTPPVYEWLFAYPLPSDYLRLIETYHDIHCVIENKQLLTNESSVYIKYIYRCTDTTLFNQLFDEALASRLGSDIAYTLTQSSTLTQGLYNLYKEKLRDARTYDSQEGTPKKPDVSEDVWLNARY